MRNSDSQTTHYGLSKYTFVLKEEAFCLGHRARTRLKFMNQANKIGVNESQSVKSITAENRFYCFKRESSAGTLNWTPVRSHRNNRYRMRTPLFCQSKSCLYKMAVFEGHFLLVPILRVSKVGGPRGVKLFTFFNIL